jgi:SAM-dependent methyltransferase
MAEPFAYDVVEYPSAGLPQMHPAHLFAVARMFGCDPAPVETCRYLELGCGDGTHLIACAIGLPDAIFVGVDLSAEAVGRGRKLIAELGLTNVALHAADVTVWAPPAGGFDYACAHGLYSWVPAPVRDAAVAVLGTALPAHGVGYVSYNAYPGCYVRRMVWEVMRHHTANTHDPARKVREATDLLKFLIAGLPTEGRKPPADAYAHEMTELLREKHPAALYHDDLSAVNDPVYFHQFAEHAGRHGLRFVAEAEPELTETRAFPPMITGVLDGMAAKDVLLKEQYLDFLRLRRFRQTVLAKDGHPPAVRPDETRVSTLAVSGPLGFEGDTADLHSPATLTFRRAEAMVQTDQPLIKAVLLTLAERAPQRMTFEQLLNETAKRLGRGEPTADDRSRLCVILTQAWMVGVIALHGHIPQCLDRVSERPSACPFARARCRDGGAVTTRLFKSQTFDDAPIRRLLELLDGTRTVDQIAAGLADAFQTDERPEPATLRAEVDRRLRIMARDGLLVG